MIAFLVLLQTNSYAQNGRLKSKLKLMSKLKFSTKKIELGLNVGFMNYSGDLKKEYYTWRQANVAASFQIRSELNKYVAVRLFTSYGHIEAKDSKTRDYDLKKRNLSFRSPITEFGFITELSLPISHDIRAEETDPKRYYKVVPYLLIGIQGFNFNPMAYYKDKWVDLQPLHTEGKANTYNLTQIAIPFGFGFKYPVNDKITVAFEIGVRKTFTDYLDDVSNTYQTYEAQKAENGQLSADISFRTDELPGRELSKPLAGQKRGNPSKNDIYLSNMFSFRYMLGK